MRDRKRGHGTVMYDEEPCSASKTNMRGSRAICINASRMSGRRGNHTWWYKQLLVCSPA